MYGQREQRVEVAQVRGPNHTGGVGSAGSELPARDFGSQRMDPDHKFHNLIPGNSLIFENEFGNCRVFDPLFGTRTKGKTPPFRVTFFALGFGTRVGSVLRKRVTGEGGTRRNPPRC